MMKLKNIRYEPLIFSALFMLLIFLHQYSEKPYSGKPLKHKQLDINKKIEKYIERPVPTEIVQKKKDRKLFKKSRKEYIDLIHKVDSDLDWRKMDSKFRKERSLKNTNNRKQYINENGYWEGSNREVFLNRDLEGIWAERGSNNLAGRVHTLDIDFENDFIYLGSSGGNIWKGTIDGENWQSLNDYMQINDIKIIRLAETENFRRLLIGSSDGFFYTDDEGVIINQSLGLESPIDWGEFYRFIIKGEAESLIIYALAKEWDSGSTISIYKSTDLGVSF